MGRTLWSHLKGLNCNGIRLEGRPSRPFMSTVNDGKNPTCFLVTPCAYVIYRQARNLLLPLGGVLLLLLPLPNKRARYSETP